MRQKMNPGRFCISKSDAIDLSVKVLTYNTWCISQSLKPPAMLTGKSFKRERETWDVHFNPGLFNVCPLTVWARHHFNGMYSDKANKMSRWLIIWALYQYDFPVCFSAARWWGPNWIQFLRVCEQTGWGSLCTFVYQCESFFSLMSVDFYYSRFIPIVTNALWLNKCLSIVRPRLNHGKNYVMQHHIRGGPSPKTSQTSLLINESFQYLSKLFTVMPWEDLDGCHDTACNVMGFMHVNHSSVMDGVKSLPPAWQTSQAHGHKLRPACVFHIK